MMDKQLFLGVFADESDILEATRATRAAGYDIYDIYTPYAVHGLDQAMGLRPSKLTWVCLAFAVLGFAFGLYAQFWIESISWPLNVGGKPFNSLPAYLPVIFELTVLFGGLGVVFTMFLRTKLFPGKTEALPYEGITDNRFVLAIEERDASFDPESLRQLWQGFGLLEARHLAEGWH